METTMNVMGHNIGDSGARPEQAGVTPRSGDSQRGRQHDDVVYRGEFRLLLWIGAFALTPILGGMTFLYTAIMDLRVAMTEEHAELRTELETKIEKTRTDLEAQINETRTDLEAQINETRTEIKETRTSLEGQIQELRADMQSEHVVIRRDISGLRERIVRVETHLGITPVEN